MAKTLRERIEALRPWPEGERLIQSLLRLETTVTGRESLSPEGLLCGFAFEGGNLCGSKESHLIHHGGWRGPEPNHDYQPLERRHGERRRSQEVPHG